MSAVPLAQVDEQAAPFAVRDAWTTFEEYRDDLGALTPSNAAGVTQCATQIALAYFEWGHSAAVEALRGYAPAKDAGDPPKDPRSLIADRVLGSVIVASTYLALLIAIVHRWLW